jgi:uncharacterized protein with WD repeat
MHICSNLLVLLTEFSSGVEQIFENFEKFFSFSPIIFVLVAFSFAAIGVAIYFCGHKLLQMTENKWQAKHAEKLDNHSSEAATETEENDAPRITNNSSFFKKDVTSPTIIFLFTLLICFVMWVGSLIIGFSA